MKAIFILLICGYTILACIPEIPTIEKPKKASKSDQFLFYYVNIYLPAEKRRQGCARPNSIQFQYTELGCLDNRVGNGLIYDADTKVELPNENGTIGKSFLCQCGSIFNYSIWAKVLGNIDADFSNLPLQYLFSSSVNVGDKTNKPLAYNVNYNTSENFVCIAYCPNEGNVYRYQFLRIK